MLILVASLLGLMLIPLIVLLAPLLVWFILPMAVMAVGVYATSASKKGDLLLVGPHHRSSRITQ
jgi:hypothetical protein